MYEVWFLQDKQKGCVVNPVTGTPVTFTDTVKAWEFIMNVMNSDTHPQFMWLKTVNVE